MPRVRKFQTQTKIRLPELSGSSSEILSRIGTLLNSPTPEVKFRNPKTRPKIHGSESDLQISIVQLIQLRTAQDWRYGLIYAVPNGEYRHPKTAARLKLQGVKPGVADLVVACPSIVEDKLRHALYLELKTPVGKLSPHQESFRDLVVRAGAVYAVAVTLTFADALLTQWFHNSPIK